MAFLRCPTEHALVHITKKPYDVNSWRNIAVISSQDKDDITHWQCVCSHCACAAWRDLCVGSKFFPHIWSPWNHFAYSLYNFYGATIKINGVIRQNSHNPVLKSTALCACAKARQYWTLPQIFYHHRSRRPRFPANRFKCWQSDGIQGNFYVYFHCACAETAIYELPVKILTSPFNFLIPISLWSTIFPWFDDVFCWFLHWISWMSAIFLLTV